MKYVHQISQPDGRVFLYLRKKGLPSVRLPEGLSEAALERHVLQLIEDLSPTTSLAKGTMAAAIRAYELENPDFKALAASTKYLYRAMLKEFEDDLGTLMVSAFTPAFVDRLKGTWAGRGHRAANLRLQVLRNVLKPALVAGKLKQDPFPLVGQVRRPRELKEPHLIWSDATFRTVMEAALETRRFGLARAVAVARYIGARRGDLVAVPRSARQDGRFQYVSGKRRVRVDVIEDPELGRWLARTPDAPPAEPRQGRKVKSDAAPVATTTLVYNVSGRPYTEDGLALELRKLVAKLHEAGRLDSPRYDLHGLRHTRGVELALAGCSDAEGAAMMGHGGPSSFMQYRRQADRVRLSDTASARVAKLREQAENAEWKMDWKKGGKNSVRNEKGPG